MIQDVTLTRPPFPALNWFSGLEITEKTSHSGYQMHTSLVVLEASRRGVRTDAEHHMYVTVDIKIHVNLME